MIATYYKLSTNAYIRDGRLIFKFTSPAYELSST